VSRRRAEPEPPDLETTLETALRFLGARPRTQWELRRRLQRSGADDDVLEAALARLTDLGYVDDEAFVRWWSEQRDRHAPRGRRLIEAELRQKGVPREVIERLREAPLERAEEDAALPETDEQRASAALERHLHGRPIPDDLRAVQRLGMFLIRRGFDAETARRAIRQHATESGDP
jgi:regulatory protein